MSKFLLAMAAMAFATPAAAEVVSADPHGFEIRHQVALARPPGTLWHALGKIDRWWSKDHSYSGNAANLTLGLTPGGCFCEKLPGGGGIEHLRVTYVDPGKRVVLTGALGPLLYEAVVGVMDIEVKPAGLTITYRAAGFARGGADKMASLVDGVIGEQAKRLAAYAATIELPAASP